MANEVKQSPLGKVAFGTVQEPRLNQLSNKLEWNIGIIISHAEATPLLEIIEEAIADAAKARPKFAATPKAKLNLPYKPAQILMPDGTKKEDPENFLFVFKRNAMRMNPATGEESRTSGPILYGSDGVPLTSFNKVIGRDTIGSAVFRPYCYDKFAVGVQFQLEGFQISQLVEMSAAPATLAPVAGNITNATEELSILDGEALSPL